MLYRQGSPTHPVDLTMVLHSKSGTWQVDDGADTDRGDPLAELCTQRGRVQRAQEHQRYQLGVRYKVAISRKSYFRKRNAQEHDFNYEVAELVQTREKCTTEHEHCEACFETLCMRFLESKRERWLNPASRKCMLLP